MFDHVDVRLNEQIIIPGAPWKPVGLKKNDGIISVWSQVGGMGRQKDDDLQETVRLTSTCLDGLDLDDLGT